MYTIYDEANDETIEVKSQEDLEGVSTPALVQTYNELAGKDIKKFQDRATAVSRVWGLIGEVDAAPEKVPTSGSTGRKSAINKQARVRLQVSGNPKRPDSQAAAHWEKYRDGITVAELQRKGVHLADIRWNEEKGFITLEEPKA